MRELDCRKLHCPEPILRTKQALEEGTPGPIIVLVGNEAARDNVSRFARHHGYAAAVEDRESGYAVVITAPAGEPSVAGDTPGPCVSQDNPENRVLLIGSDRLGQGSEELGRLLMRNFFYTLTRNNRPPDTLVFINAGVKLCIRDSAVIDELSLLERNGVRILACGTCLDYFELTTELAVGQVTNMYDIAELLCGDTRFNTL